jgi:penicillin-binding protein 2
MADPFEQSPPRQRLIYRFGVFALIVVLAVGVLTTRLFSLQVAGSGPQAGRAADGRLSLQPIRSPRGLIYDRAGRVLAFNVPSYVVRVRPAELPLSDRPAVVARLSTLLGVSERDIIEALDRNAGLLYEPARIATDVPLEVARIIDEEASALPGVEVVVENRRQYDYGPLVSQLLGYTAGVTAADLNRLAGEGYLADDVMGKAGVEATYESIMRGAYGLEQIERDAAGRFVRRVQVVQPPTPGNSIELTIDVEVQREAEQAVAWAIEVAGLQRGAIVVMDPQTGEVLAMVSLPTYDNNLFARGISQSAYQQLLNAPGQPLVNHAVSGQYPPGSTYKLVTGVGALEDGIVRPLDELQTAPYLEINGYKYWEWNRKGFGLQNMYGAFARSANTYFFQLAGEMGIDRLAYWGTQFGFGQRTGIELPAEARGIVPTDEWKREVFDQPIYPGEVYQAGIGQGYDTATVLQVANAYVALANGGKLLKPQIVRRVLDGNGAVVRDFQPEVLNEIAARPDVLRHMRLAARETALIRAPGSIGELPFVVASKTGTAQFGVRDSQGRLPFHSWNATFVPRFGPSQVGDPERTDSELVVVAFAYESNTKGNAATEMVKYFLQLHYDVEEDLRRPDLLERGNFYGGA